jgi:Heavy metal binding domain
VWAIYKLSIQRRAFIFGIFPAIRMLAQSLPAAGNGGPAQDPPVEFVCPMHPDVRSAQPGVCPRCGMKLVANLPERLEYPLKLALEPRTPQRGKELTLALTVFDPKTGRRVTDFQVMHEKLYHLFIVSQDLKYFVHDHPVLGADGVFRYKTSLPEAGMYRVLSDFYPTGGTPQLIVKSIVLPGAAISPGAALSADLASKDASNMRVSLIMQPEKPIAGMKTLMFFHLDPVDGLKPYLGAWSHMLVASDDLIDMVHYHPVVADGGPQMQFNVILPRARTYKIWVQFQRKGVVNTAEFNVPVAELK